MEVRPLQTRVWHNALEIVVDVIWAGDTQRAQGDAKGCTMVYQPDDLEVVKVTNSLC